MRSKETNRRKSAWRYKQSNYRKLVVSLLIQRDGNLCQFCAIALDDHPEIDHIKPLVFGGANEAYNLRLVHSVCNRTSYKQYKLLMKS